MFYIGFLFKKMRDLLILTYLVSDVSESLRSLTKKERCEQIDQVSHQKLATVSDSLRSLTKNEQMSELLVFWANHSFNHFFIKKTSDLLRKPMREFPALLLKVTMPNFREYQQFLMS